jgi:hypothetical protein
MKTRNEAWDSEDFARVGRVTPCAPLGLSTRRRRARSDAPYLLSSLLNLRVSASLRLGVKSGSLQSCPPIAKATDAQAGISVKLLRARKALRLIWGYFGLFQLIKEEIFCARRALPRGSISPLFSVILRYSRLFFSLGVGAADISKTLVRAIPQIANLLPLPFILCAA